MAWACCRRSDAVVAGPLCEPGDTFTQSVGGVVLPRALSDAPPVSGPLSVHDTRAYGASLSSKHNTRPLAAETLVYNGQARLIRRPSPDSRSKRAGSPSAR